MIRSRAIWCLSMFLIVLWGRIAMAAENYPQAVLLMEPVELAKSPETFVILDARSGPNYAELHVRDAIWVDHDEWSKAFGDGNDAEGWSKRIGDLGIDAKTRVVVYDDNDNKSAARIWWILRYWGVEDVRLVNGGWKGWFKEHLPFGSGTPVPPEPKSFKAEAIADKLATKEELLRSLEKHDLQIVDARSAGEHCGTEQLKNKRAGAIPGAKHLEWSDLIDKETGRFKSADDLKQLFSAAGIELDRPTATHCQGGGRAAVMAFGMELMGAPQVSNYYKSWGEWGNADDTPIEQKEK